MAKRRIDVSNQFVIDKLLKWRDFFLSPFLYFVNLNVQTSELPSPRSKQGIHSIGRKKRSVADTLSQGEEAGRGGAGWGGRTP